MEWKKESNYVIHESGFTIIVEEGSVNNPSSIRVNQSEGFDALEQARLLREGLKFGRSFDQEERNWVAPLGINTSKITVKKKRKIQIPDD